MEPKDDADFQNADATSRVRLNAVGTIEDLARQGLTLREGLRLTLYADDLDATGQADELRAVGVVSFSEEEHCWVAAMDWSALHHASAEQRAPANGAKTESVSERLRPGEE